MRSFQGWLVFAMLLGTMAYAIAEEVTLTTLYPSPRGMYAQLRVRDGVTIGRSFFNTNAGRDGLIVEGRVGIGTATPEHELDLEGTGRMRHLILPGGVEGQFLRSDAEGNATWASLPAMAPAEATAPIETPKQDDSGVLRGSCAFSNAPKSKATCAAVPPAKCAPATPNPPYTCECEAGYDAVMTGVVSPTAQIWTCRTQ